MTTYSFPEESSTPKSDRCILYLILAVVICNILITFMLGCGLYYVAANTETEAKRISGEILEEKIEAFRNYMDNEENREELISNLAKIFVGIAKHSAHDVTNHFKQEVANTMVPYDVFSIAEYLINYDFTTITQLMSESLHSISASFMNFPKYQDAATAFSATASVLDIVSGVQPLTTNTAAPTSNEYSLLGQALLRLPEVLTNSLSSGDWRDVAADCATLSNRFYFANFMGTYETAYGTESFNYNADIKPVFSNLYDVCVLLAASPETNPEELNLIQ